MPGWHHATKELQQQGRVQMVGIIQEQHPDRARLFMQWKQMDWPILVDSLDLLEVSLVPLTLVIDESGIIRAVQPPLNKAEEIGRELFNDTVQESSPLPGPRVTLPNLKQLEAMTSTGSAEAWRAYANALVMWGGTNRLSEAITAYQRALRIEPGHGFTHFRLGVAYRKRYDSEQRQAHDFQKAIEQWAEALESDPNQYIWRRRIQQYGPRLNKPYPFYDWVITARKEIQARGETPVPLRVEPGGAEFARPIRTFKPAEATKKEPDPRGRIHRDKGRLIHIETTLAPPVIAPGGSARVHLVFRPNRRVKAHWNNEVGDLVFWVNQPNGWLVNHRSLTLANPRKPVSRETRTLEFEVRCPETAEPGSVTIPGYALYYVCEDVNGTCLYRRQDISIQVKVGNPAL